MMSDGCQGREFRNGNSFLGLHSHPVYSGKPSDKAVTFLVAKNTTHTNQENSAPLSLYLYSERIVLLQILSS